MEYRGKVVTHDEADQLYDGSVESGHTFLFTLNERYLIDANRDGNAARWINHSCQPNCEAVLVEHRSGDQSRDRIFIQTMRLVLAGEELSYDYGITLDCRQTRRLHRLWACCCGLAGCTGTMLKPKSRARRPATRQPPAPDHPSAQRVAAPASAMAAPAP